MIWSCREYVQVLKFPSEWVLESFIVTIVQECQGHINCEKKTHCDRRQCHNTIISYLLVKIRTTEHTYLLKDLKFPIFAFLWNTLVLWVSVQYFPHHYMEKVTNSMCSQRYLSTSPYSTIFFQHSHIRLGQFELVLQFPSNLCILFFLCGCPSRIDKHRMRALDNKMQKNKTTMELDLLVMSYVRKNWFIAYSCIWKWFTKERPATHRLRSTVCKFVYKDFNTQLKVFSY